MVQFILSLQSGAIVGLAVPVALCLEKILLVSSPGFSWCFTDYLNSLLKPGCLVLLVLFLMLSI